MTDKYHLIPGVMDTIDCLRKEIKDLKMQLERATAGLKEISLHQKAVAGTMADYSTTKLIADRVLAWLEKEI